MHIADPKLGIFGANGIVAAGLPIAVGAAAASQLRSDGGVAVSFFGDGADCNGQFHESFFADILRRDRNSASLTARQDSQNRAR